MHQAEMTLLFPESVNALEFAPESVAGAWHEQPGRFIRREREDLAAIIIEDTPGKSIANRAQMPPYLVTDEHGLFPCGRVGPVHARRQLRRIIRHRLSLAEPLGGSSALPAVAMDVAQVREKLSLELHVIRWADTAA